MQADFGASEEVNGGPGLELSQVTGGWTRGPEALHTPGQGQPAVPRR